MSRIRPWPVPQRIKLHSLIIVATSALTAIPATAAEPTVELPVRAVALFSSGVGYTEHGGRISGDADVVLSFKTRQINDVLKSLVIEDRGADGSRARPGAVTFPSQQPLRRTLADFQINLSKNPTMAAILKQVRGAAITARHQGEQIDGTLLSVEQRPIAMGKTGDLVNDWVITLSNEGRLRTMALREITEIELADPTLREELARALAAISAGRNRNAKPVTVRFTGNGERDVRLGYVSEAPVWKTSYRIVVPAGAGDPYLQGWAIVENQSQNDWHNIDLSLISGRPISFVQNLYQPLYAKRPEVPVQTQVAVTPRRHAGGQTKPKAKTINRFNRMSREPEPRKARLAEDRAPQAAVSEALMSRPAAPRLDPTQTAAAATGEDVGGLFEYTVNEVTLARQQSAMLPIVAQTISGEKISLYNETTHRTRAMNGLMLKNSIGLQLPAGAVTVFDGGLYAGDALLSDLPNGQDRMITYAIDLDIDVQFSPRPQARAITSGRIVKGVLQMTYKSRRSHGYVVQNKSDRAKSLVIETRKTRGWKLVDTPKPWQTTQKHYRFRIPLAANERTELKIHQEIVRAETLALLDATQAKLVEFSRNGAFAPGVRDAFAKAAKMQHAVMDTKRRIQQRESAVKTYVAEQKRVRENLRSVGKGTKFHSRMMAKLDQLESAIEAAYGNIETLRRQLTTERGKLETYLANINVGP